MTNQRCFRVERPSQLHSKELFYERERKTLGGVFIKNTIIGITILAKELIVKKKGTSLILFTRLIDAQIIPHI